jgi:hypothetical protein
MLAATEREFRVPRGGAKLPVGVWDLICWAFQRGGGRLDWNEEATGFVEMQAWDTIAKLEAINKLGCRVQGGGRSEPDHDADVVTSTLAVLPVRCGGRRMAVNIAEYARSGRMPEWRCEQKVEPVEWVQNRYGRFGKVADSRDFGGWPPQARQGRKGVIYEPVMCVPVHIVPSAAVVAAARRHYLDFYLALLEVKSALEISHLTRFEITDAMPPRTPWKENGLTKS